MYFFRTRNGLETDLVVEDGTDLRLFELKSGMTIVPKHVASLNRFRAFLEPNAAKAYILSAARGRFPLGRGAWSINWLDALGR